MTVTAKASARTRNPPGWGLNRQTPGTDFQDFR